MTIRGILNDIYIIEDLLALGNNEKTDAAVAALCCATKIIAKHDLLEEIFYHGVDVRSLSDDDLKLYHDWLHNEKLITERELYKRHIP